MNLFFYICLFIFWTMFGSFASVIIYRLRSGEWWIWWGRSHCKTCERNLSAFELIPLLSWIFQWGKCSWCKEKISPVYPLLELTLWTLFVATWIFLVDPNLIYTGNPFEWGKMLFFLTLMFLTLIYVFYDILYLEIPESVLFIANICALWGLIVQDSFWGIFPYLAAWNISVFPLLLTLMVLGGLYTIMLAELKEIEDSIILVVCMFLLWYYLHTWGLSYNESALISGSIAALGIFTSFFLQIVLSKGRWMGAWDLRIAILMWLLVGASFAFSAWMITYLVWSIIGVFLIFISKIRHGMRSEFNHQIPFWPFLASWYLSILFFSPYIWNFIEWYF